MSLSKFLALSIVGIVASSSIASATINGLSTNPFGDPSVGYATFDTFTSTGAYPTVKVTNQAPGLESTESGSATGGSIFTATLSADMGGSAAGSGARIYNGVGAGSSAFNVSIDGVAHQEITTLSLQIKFTKGDGYDFDNFFALTLNGVAATGVVTVGDGSLGLLNGSDVGVVQWTWTGLSLAPGSNFSLGITSPAAGHVSIDALRVDVVPEPSTYALIGLAGVGFALARRRRAFSKA